MNDEPGCIFDFVRSRRSQPKQNKWGNLLKIETGSVSIFQITSCPSFQVQEKSNTVYDEPHER